MKKTVLGLIFLSSLLLATSCAGSRTASEAPPSVTPMKGGNPVAVPASGLSALKDRAMSGNPQAELELGYDYLNGVGVGRNEETAVGWFRAAASSGNAAAEAALGLAYATGRGVPTDSRRAFGHFLRAARQGNAFGELGVGFLLEKGEGVPKDLSRAIRWYQKAAAQGNVVAKRRLAALGPPSGAAGSAHSPAGPSSPGAESSALSAQVKRLEEENALILAKLGAPQTKRHFKTSVDHPNYTVRPHSRDFALVIGVERYPSPIPSAEFADRDARAVRAHLRALGIPSRHIRVLSDRSASLARIRSSLTWLSLNVPPGGTVYFYFSGHGSPSEKGDAYLVPVDGDPLDLPETGLSLGGLYRDLGRLPARHVVVILDACFTGEGKRSIIGAGVRPLIAHVREGSVAASGRLIVMTAAKADQESGVFESKGHGLFTYFLLKGLNGGAVEQGHITLASLFHYLRPRVQREAHLDNRRQTPELEPLHVGSQAAQLLR